jgi:hypothetical protein
MNWLKKVDSECIYSGTMIDKAAPIANENINEQ